MERVATVLPLSRLTTHRESATNEALNICSKPPGYCLISVNAAIACQAAVSALVWVTTLPLPSKYQ